MATPEVDEAPASTAMPIADPTVTSAQPAETALPPPSPVHNTLLADRIDPATAPVTAPIVPTAVPTSTAPATAPPLTPDDSVSPPLVRALTTTALGPATEAEPLSPTATNTTGPTLLVTLLLTTGARHPYKIDHRYLSSRSALPAASAGGEFDPRDLSGYKLKELIWTDWRKEWEDRPESVGSIRLIVMGKLVEDGKSLRDYPFKLDSANVVHMTVKPADFDIEDDAAAAGKTGKSGSIRQRDGGESGAGCRCVIL